VFRRVPEIDEEAKKYGLNFKIIDADNRVVKLVEISKISEE
jgi:CBS domain containing-hemolysin-like protein